MLKFMVVICKRQDMSDAEFQNYLKNIHGPIARKLPGLRRYLQNFPQEDPQRNHPLWDAIVELYFDNRETMEAAWASPEGAASDADLPLLVDVARTTWSVVEEVTVLDSRPRNP
jgi:uncharacterized protein (TIGR02118 family)